MGGFSASLLQRLQDGEDSHLATFALESPRNSTRIPLPFGAGLFTATNDCCISLLPSGLSSLLILSTLVPSTSAFDPTLPNGPGLAVRLILSTIPLSDPLAAEPMKEGRLKDHEEELLGVKREAGLGDEGEEERSWRWEEMRVVVGGRRGVS